MLAQFWARFRAHIAPFHDKRALIFIALCLGGTWLFDPVMAKTIGQFMLPAGAFAAFLVIISRYLFPQISLGMAVQQAAEEKSVAAGLLVLAVSLFMSFGFLALALWMRA